MTMLTAAIHARRSRLHERYAQLSRLPDASRLAFLNGPEHTWTLQEAAQMWAKADPQGSGRLQPQNNMYLHVPFCKSICSFCNYDRLRPSSPKMLKVWEERLFDSIEVLAPAVQPLIFQTLYIGGGTPSVLPPDQLERVLIRLADAFQWHPRAARHFEFDPSIMNDAKLAILTKHQFTHFSFGIQTLQANINAAHNRGKQSIEIVAKRFNEFQAKGIEQVSCDFLAGLAGTTPEDILGEVEQVVSQFKPAWVDVFMITPTAEYVTTHYNGSYDQFFEHLLPFQQAMPRGLAQISKQYDYQFMPGQGHHLCLQRKDSPHPRGGVAHSDFTYSQLVSEAKVPINLLGLGPSARSQIFGVASLQTRDPSDDPLETGAPVFQGHPRTLSDEAVTFLAHDLRDTDVVHRQHFEDLFGADIEEILPLAVAAWTTDAGATLSPNQLRLAPHDRQARTRALLWAVEESALEHEIASHMALDLTPVGLAKLLHPLPLETRLAEGVVLESVTHGHMRLRVPGGGSHQIRISPPMDNDSPPSLVVLSGPNHATGRVALMRAVQQLQKLIARNHKPWVPDSP